ncbi:MAG: sigma-70 family RNA polymerase sigma factor [Isosphaeraceae bacterium]|nr:sigma-70 family RNA polymerase sigma factor [Isosphaeraceae bacterium]
MAARTYGAVLQQIDRLFHGGTGAGLPEWQLLNRYVTRRDESAFEAIVARHGPMVLGVCRRVLDDPHAVEDAFQATFLVLVRKAGSLSERDAIGHWLYGVAHRVALRARADSARRRAREKDGTAVATSAPPEEPGRSELESLLDDELSRLPAKYRAPIVLCYLQGLTHEEAATQLGWPVGTVKGRLARARELLRGRLARRGVAPGLGVVTATLSQRSSAAVTDPLIATAARAISQFTAGRFKGGLVSATAARLTEGVLSTMFVTKLKVVAAISLSCSGLLLGAWVLAQESRGRAGDRATEPGTKPVAAEDFGSGRTKEQALDDAMEKPLPLQFKAATLETVLKHIRAETAGQSIPSPNGVPIYVDPTGLDEAGATMQSPVSIAAKDLPLRDSLDAMLRPLKLAATSRDGMLVISSRQEVALIEIRKLADQLRSKRRGANDTGTAGDPEELSPAAWLQRLPGRKTVYHSDAGSDESTPEDEAKTRAILEALKKRIPMEFANETPLEDVFAYIREETKTKDFPGGLPIYVDPVGLQEAEKTLASPVQMDIKGVALRETLRLMLKQLGLVYEVRDGIVTITSAESEDMVPVPILTLAKKAERGELSLDEMKHLVEVFRIRAEVERYASGQPPVNRTDAQPKATVPSVPPPSNAKALPAEEADDDATSQAIHAALDKVVALHFTDKPVDVAIKEIEKMTIGPELPEGIPLYISPLYILPAPNGPEMKVSIDLKRVKLKTGLRLLLGQVGLAYTVKEGLLIIASAGSPELSKGGMSGGMGGGMMGGMGGGFR